MQTHSTQAGFALLALMTALMMAPSSTLAANSVGRIISVQGIPKVERATGDLTEIRRDDPIHVGDIVRTGTGRAKILFVDNSIMTLGENTDLKITEFLFEPKEEKRSSMFDLIGGKVKTLVGKLFSSAPDYKVRTPTAVAGVRGTFFQVDFEGDTEITVFDGEVDVENEAGEVLQLLSGNQLKIGSLGFIGGVSQLSPQQLATKQAEIEVRLQELLNQQADKSVDRRGFARRAVDSLSPPAPETPADDDESFNTIDADGGTPSDPLGGLQSADPARGGNVNLETKFPRER